MTMPNREIAALNRESRAREELTVAIKSGQGKEYRKERELWEKAAGGKKKLAAADKVLADARREYEKIVSDGNKVAEEATAEVIVSSLCVGGRLDEKARVLTNKEVKLDQLRDTLATESQDCEDKRLTLVEREDAVAAGENALVSAKNLVAARENAATAREAEIKRFDDWRAAAPT